MLSKGSVPEPHSPLPTSHEKSPLPPKPSASEHSKAGKDFLEQLNQEVLADRTATASPLQTEVQPLQSVVFASQTR